MLTSAIALIYQCSARPIRNEDWKILQLPELETKIESFHLFVLYNSHSAEMLRICFLLDGSLHTCLVFGNECGMSFGSIGVRTSLNLLCGKRLQNFCIMNVVWPFNSSIRKLFRCPTKRGTSSDTLRGICSGVLVQMGTTWIVGRDNIQFPKWNPGMVPGSEIKR